MIDQGEKIVLQGQNGAGKTTLLRILSGLLKPQSGSFFINDDSYNRIDLQRYRSHIGIIINGETPFEGTIRENITFNDPTITDSDLAWALQAVQLGSYIRSLPMGLETPIFPEGKQLSSSNAKKILLARSIIHRPLLLFLEDPTDTMDDDAAKSIINFLMGEPQWTVIVTAKNAHWQAHASRIITMQEGRIINDKKTKSHA
ncbi:MAG TPA: ATP-binding cassette domain-containing protein [Flavobacterium sp.]